MAARIQAIVVGGPKSPADARGVWQSSIERERSDVSVGIGLRGIVGDSVAQPHHGGPDAALCVPLADHYRFWREQYGMGIASGAVGESFTPEGLTENEVCGGDIVRVGSVKAQVSGRVFPARKSGRRPGRADWVRLTICENRTGSSLRVLEPGIVKTDAAWIVEQRFDGEAILPKIKLWMHLRFEKASARRMLDMNGLGAWWRTQTLENSRTEGRTGCLP